MADEATEATPASEQAPAPQNDPPAAERTFTQEEVNRIAGEARVRERQKYADYEDLKGKAARFDEFEQSQKTELEKALERAKTAEQRFEQAQKSAQDASLRSAIVSAAAERRVVDVDAAAALIDRSGITFGEDGSPTGVSESLDALIGQKPWLVGHGASAGNADQGARSGSGENQLTEAAIEQMTPEQIVEAQKKGMLQNVLSGG